MSYKVFSFSTTIRNPQRNIEFLQCLRRFNGLVFDWTNYRLCFEEFVKNGVYKLSNIPKEINEKLNNEITLNDADFEKLLKFNPQISDKKKIIFRINTHLKALEYQGFLVISKNKTAPSITLTNLAFELMDGKSYTTDIYTKIMIGTHFSNPTKPKILNKSRVFLNTIFVIDLLKKEWEKLTQKEAKGILKYEFPFVLGMKNCDYKQCVKDILAYRKIHGLKENKDYIRDYLFNKMDLENLSDGTLNDYADEVFRKFEMTGLLTSRGKFKHIYYDFSVFNVAKINALLETYKNYKFKEFQNISEYITFLDKVKLPWLADERVRKEVVKQKAKTLKVEFKESDLQNLNDFEEKLDQEFYSKALQNAISQSDINELLKELKILISTNDENSKYKEIPEPLRLEYLLALILGKKYGTKNLKSNLIYNENGLPLSYAPAGKGDLFYSDFLFEATMIKNRNQQLNSETTSVARHMKESADAGQDLRTMLVAPYIHWDVALFFKFCAKEFESKLAPITIANFVELIEQSPNFSDFKANFDTLFVSKLANKKTDEYVDFVNF